MITGRKNLKEKVTCYCNLFKYLAINVFVLGGWEITSIHPKLNKCNQENKHPGKVGNKCVYCLAKYVIPPIRNLIILAKQLVIIAPQLGFTISFMEWK